MFTCKQVSNALADGDYASLPPLKRWLLKVHVTLCFICHRPNRHIMIFQDMMRAFRRREETLPVDTRLPDAARQRIRDAMRH